MRVYFIKVALRGISPMIWRRLRVPGLTSLAVLHHCIQIINSWDDINLHQFHIYGKDYGSNHAGAAMFSDNAYKVYLDDFNFDIGDKFTYEYNFHEHNIHDIRIENIKDLMTADNKIICLSGSGMPGAIKYNCLDIEFKFIKKIVNKKRLITVEDIRDFQEKMNQVKFNKKAINNQLASLKV